MLYHPRPLGITVLTPEADLTEAMGDGRVWNMQYSVFPGWHATDLLPTFFSPAFASDQPFLDDLAMLFVPVLGPLVAGISAAMQSYFASYVTAGDPNVHRKVWNAPPAVRWDHPRSSASQEAGGGEHITGVLDVGGWGFGAVTDDKLPKAACDFWRRFAAAVTALGGYAPPGAVVAQDLVRVEGNVSRNFLGGNML